MSGIYAPTSRFRNGSQSQYDAGLSYFPDTPFLMATPLGDVSAGTLATAAGTVVGGPVGGATAATLVSLASSLFGGSAVDQQRLARVNYFLSQAAQGNVAAAQLILGAPPNVSGNERPMWQQAWAQLQNVAPSVAQQANDAGPVWLVGSGDTATNYPAMKNFTAAWATAHPLTALTGAVGGYVADFLNPNPYPPTNTTPLTGPVYTPAPSSSHASQLLILGAVAAGVYALTRRRR